MRALVVAGWFLVVGCGGEDPKQYTTFQECFDDKTEKQDKMKIESIVECCVDHEIAGAKPPVCGVDQPECINYLTANLDQTDADITVKMEACAAYDIEKNKQ